MGSSKNNKQRDDGFNLEGMSQRDVEAAAERKKYRRNVAIIGTILIVFTLAVIVFTSGFSYRHIPSVTVNDESFSTTEYNYYYNSLYYRYYNNYYAAYGEYAEAFMPAEEQLREETLSFIAQVKMINDEAEKNGFTLSAESQAMIESEFENLKTIAHENSYPNISSYLGAYYGKGMNASVFRECMTESQLASEYTAYLTSTYEYTDSELQNFYTENEDEYDFFNYRYFYFSGAEVAADEEAGIEAVDAETAMAEAKANAKAFAAAVTDEASFNDLAYEYAAEAEKEYYEDADATLLETQGQSLSEDIASWLTSATRQEGDVTAIESSTGWTVVYFISRDDNDYLTKNVRHVLIESTGDDEADGGMANDLFKKWQSEDGTEEGFAAMADEYSADTGSVGNGGLYENVYKNQMVAEFDAWIYDESREAGDAEVVKTALGYHIMYFVGDGENCRDHIAKTDMTNSDYSEWLAAQMANYAISTNWWFDYTVKK